MSDAGRLPIERVVRQGDRPPTGASLAAIILVIVAVGAVTILHVVRGEVHPVSRVMSEYANGEHGRLMTITFYAFGLSSIALGFRLSYAIVRHLTTRIVTGLLVLGGISLLAAGIFEVERALVPDTIEEVIHSYATMAAFVMIVTVHAALLVRLQDRQALVGIPHGLDRPVAHRRRRRDRQPIQRGLGLVRSGPTGTRRSRSVLVPRHRAARSYEGLPPGVTVGIGRVLAPAGILSSFACVTLLHLLRTDLPPLERRLSEYANGPHGWLMTLAFIGLAVGLAGFAAALWASGRTRADRLAAGTAVVAAIASVVSAVFRTNVSSESEAVHSPASTVAVLAVVALAVLYTWSTRDASLGSRPLLLGLAGAAVALAAVSPVLHETRWSGLGQRLLWTALLAWLLAALWALPTKDQEAPLTRSPR